VQTAKKFTFQPEFQLTTTANSYKVATTHLKIAKKAIPQHQQPKSYAAALKKSLEASTWTTVQNIRPKTTTTL